MTTSPQLSPRVFRGFVAPLEPTSVLNAFEFLKLPGIRPGSRVFVKPNLTWKAHQPGITTSPAFLGQLAHALAQHGCRVTFGESNGGRNLFTAEEAFEGHGLYALQARYGFELMNLTRHPRRPVRLESDCVVEFSAPLLDQFDLVISSPVPKVHAMTNVSLAIKNLWGCMPDPMRIRHHWNINRILCALVAAMPPSAAVVDGTYFLNDFGPMDGTPLRRDVLIAAGNLLAASLLCCRLMNVAPGGVALIRRAIAESLGPRRVDDIHLNTPIEPFLTEVAFKAKAIPLTYLTKLAFDSKLLTRLLYDSSTGASLHRLLHRIRRVQFLRAALYRNTRFVE